MDHVVYIDAKEKDLSRLLDGSKTMIVRGAAGRKLPYGRVQPGDRLYFVQNDGSAVVRASAAVSAVLNSDKLDEDQSRQLIETHQDRLNLTPAQFTRWAGKRYLVLVSLEDVVPLEPFSIDRSAYGTMDDWLPVGQIESVRLPG